MLRIRAWLNFATVYCRWCLLQGDEVDPNQPFSTLILLLLIFTTTTTIFTVRINPVKRATLFSPGHFFFFGLSSPIARMLESQYLT